VSLHIKKIVFSYLYIADERLVNVNSLLL